MNKLTCTKRCENETVEEFNSKFSKLIEEIPIEYALLDATILLCYMDAYQGQFRMFLNHLKPTDIKDVKTKALLLNKDWIFVGKLNAIPNPRVVHPKHEPTMKVVAKPPIDPLVTIIEAHRQLEITVVQNNTTIQNRLVNLENVHAQFRNQPRGNEGIWNKPRSTQIS